MSKRPALPLEIRSEIERASEAIIEESWKTRHLLYPKEDRGFISEGYGPEPPPPKPMPAALQFELREHACALFDEEAQHYHEYANSRTELRAWLDALALRIEREVIKETRHASHDFQCKLAPRRKAIKDGLRKRIDHWMLPVKTEPPSGLFSSPRGAKEIIDTFCEEHAPCSLDDLAERAGIDRRQVFKIRNSKPVRPYARVALAEVLGVQPSELIHKHK